MTGIIVHLTPGSRSGTIHAEDGSRVLFSAAGVLGQFETLAVGHRVSFDFDLACAEPLAVRVQRHPADPKKADAPPELRYMGFNQAQNIREYKFDAIENGHPTRRLSVTVDLALFLKHHIGVQEGPALCLRKLVGAAQLCPERSRHVLESDDLAAYASSRAAAARAKSGPKRRFHRERGAAPPSPWHGVRKA